MSQDAAPGTIVLFAPHPDDETLGCGGYVAQRIDAGCRVVIVVLTMGEKLFSHGLRICTDPSPEEIRAMRREETLQATAILGVPGADVRFLEYADRSLEENAAAVGARIIPLLRELGPSEVLCTGPDEEHPDHRAASSIVRHACAQAVPGAALRWYITSLRAGLSSDALPYAVQAVDIRRQLPRKTRAVACFRAHLAILSPRQTAPIVADFRAYLAATEILLSP